jgi:hypothetical protein
MPLRFLLLMRHMARDKLHDQALDVGKGLRDYIDETQEAGPLALRLSLCLHPKKGLAACSAETLKAVEGLEGLETRPLANVNEQDPLDPFGKTANPYISRNSHADRQNQIEQQTNLLARIQQENLGLDGNAILVVGHSPQIDWLLHRLIEPPIPLRWFPWYRHAFVSGEIICVDLCRRSPSGSIRRGRAIWSLAPTDNKTEELLREKIRGKMESAKLLGGIVAAGVGFVLTGFHDLAFGWSTMMDDIARAMRLDVPSLDGERMLCFGLAISALLLATGLYCLAYLSYDCLLMPTRFWDAVEPPDRWQGIVWRPPSSSLLIMHQNMQRVWFRAFVPATLTTGIALVSLGYAAIIQQIADTLGSATLARAYFGSVLVVLAAVLFVWHRWQRPLLGVQD